MRVWTVCFVVFFILTELYQWLEGVALPLPMFVGAGALLAIASNAGNWKTLSAAVTQPSTVQPSTVQAESAPMLPPKLENTQGLTEGETPQLPTLNKQPENPFFKESSISFTLRSPKSNHPPSP
jgi:hypothetical protein